MMPVARVTDVGVGVCYCHDDPISVSGVIIPPNAPTTFSGGLNVAQLTNLVQASCGHVGVITTNVAQRTFANGLPVARLTSGFSGCFNGVIVTANQFTYAG